MFSGTRCLFGKWVNLKKASLLLSLGKQGVSCVVVRTGSRAELKVRGPTCATLPKKYMHPCTASQVCPFSFRLHGHGYLVGFQLPIGSRLQTMFELLLWTVIFLHGPFLCVQPTGPVGLIARACQATSRDCGGSSWCRKVLALARFLRAVWNTLSSRPVVLFGVLVWMTLNEFHWF